MTQWRIAARVTLALIVCIVALGNLGKGNQASAASYNVTDYGAIPNDSGDDTDAFRTALVEARRAGGKHTINVPAGTFMIRGTAPSPNNSVRVYDYLRLQGAGKTKTILKLIPGSLNSSWPTIRMVVLGQNSSVHGLTVDGNRGAIDRTKFRNISATMIATVPETTGQVISNVKTRNGYGMDQEAFAIMIGSTRNVTIRNVESSYNDGTGMSIHGSYYPSQGWASENVTVDNALFHHNGYQGVTLYGSKKVTLNGVTSYSNTLNGINIEWSKQVNVNGGLSYDNGYRGINTYGLNYSVRIDGLTTRNNGANYIQGSEAGILNGYWGGGPSNPNPVTGVIERSLTQDIQYLNCSFTPAPGKPHLYVEPDVTGTNVGKPFPRRLVTTNSGVDQWNFRINNKSGITWSALKPYVKQNFGFTLITQ